MNFHTLLKLKKTYSYTEYAALVNRLAEAGDTTGADKIPDRINATKLNAARHNRIYKTAALEEKLVEEVKKIDKPMVWLLIVESWCGDGAQNAPVAARLAELSPNVSLKVILRDEHPEIMDKYLTDGKRSIPKLIFFDTGTLSELDMWGPRPVKIQEAFIKTKTDNPQFDHDALMKELHLLYSRDQTRSMQEELVPIIQKLIARQKELVTL